MQLYVTQMGNPDTYTEVSLSLSWHLAIVALLRKRGMIPNLIGFAASACSAIEGGEPAYGVAASAIYVWLTLGYTLALPVFIGALVYVPLKTIPRGAVRPPGLTSRTTLGLAVALLMLMVFEDRWYTYVSRPLAKFIDTKPQLFGAFLSRVGGSWLDLLTVCVRAGVLTFAVVHVPPLTSRVGQMCIYYIACVAMAATIYDAYDVWALWWDRQVSLITQRL